MPTILKRIFVIIGILLIVFVVLIVSGLIITAIIDNTKLDIVSWWWYYDLDKQGLEALYKSYKTTHPDIEIYDSTMGAMIPEAVLNAELEAGKPPDSFQTGIGYGLIHSWVATGYLEPVTFIFEQNGWLDKYPPGMLGLLTYDGQIWGVPIDVRRRNILWYNQAILAQYNLAPPQSWEDFFTAAETLKAAGITPLVTDYQTTLFEAVLLSSLGPEKYRGFLNSDINWSDPLVTKALDTLSQIYTYEGDIILGAENAILGVVNGRAAMAITGEWATSYLPAKAEVGSAPTPGAQNTFIISASAYVLPKKAHHRDLAIDWLTLCGSREGQDAFSAASGNLPARIDANPVLYNDYYQSALPGWASSQVVPSLWISLDSNQTDLIEDVLEAFAAYPDVETAQRWLIQASKGREPSSYVPLR
jgi:glucose/mannose transport system substrate-binding protein